MEKMPSNSAKSLDINKALTTIYAVRQETEAMGANDFEPSAFMRIEQKLREGVMTPDEAVVAAQAIRDGKQDYH